MITNIRFKRQYRQWEMGLRDYVSDMQLLLMFGSKVQTLYSHQKDLYF